jgi:hypothetical protein
MSGNAPGDTYDDALSTIRGHVDDLGAWLRIWENRSEPDAHARRCASDAVDAVDAVDAMLRQLYLVRGRLTSEIRNSDATAARADELLRVDKLPAAHEDRPDESQR